jgi:hypothetical protein
LGQEFIIKSQDIEDKINQLLPSQGGFQAGVDFSASTTVIPIVDLTETAEGSSLRQDLQSSLSFSSVTAFNFNASTVTIVNTTGYYRIFGVMTNFNRSSAVYQAKFTLNSSGSTKIIWNAESSTGTAATNFYQQFDFIVFCQAGESLTGTTNAECRLSGCSRQLADLQGNLVNP